MQKYKISIKYIYEILISDFYLKKKRLFFIRFVPSVAKTNTKLHTASLSLSLTRTQFYLSPRANKTLFPDSDSEPHSAFCSQNPSSFSAFRSPPFSLWNSLSPSLLFLSETHCFQYRERIYWGRLLKRLRFGLIVNHCWARVSPLSLFFSLKFFVSFVVE